MIVKQGEQYHVKSEDGVKNLGTYRTKEEAEKRLREVEYFKHQGNNPHANRLREYLAKK